MHKDIPTTKLYLLMQDIQYPDIYGEWCSQLSMQG